MRATSDDPMGHLDYLQGLADQDVAQLRHKEATYQGSWKKRGGTGAFMMLARKWDRIEAMAQQCTEGGGRWDIFGLIFSQRGQVGEDGTVLAEIRDLRRYLMLVEAEMVKRGAVPVSMEGFMRTSGGAEVFAATVPVEDSNRHAEREPAERPVDMPPIPTWPVEGATQRVGPLSLEATPEEMDAFSKDLRAAYKPYTPSVFRLEEVQEEGLSDPTAIMYLNVGCGFILDRRRLYQHEVDKLPRYSIEKNYHEWHSLPAVWRQLYRWGPRGEGKFVMWDELRERWGT